MQAKEDILGDRGCVTLTVEKRPVSRRNYEAIPKNHTEWVIGATSLTMVLK